MGEIAGERSPTNTSDGARAWNAGARSAAVLVDGLILLLVPVISWAVMGQHAMNPGLGVLVAFGMLGFVLLRAESVMPLRAWARLVALPSVTATAAVLTLVLLRAPVVGFDAALQGSIRPWLAVTACLVAARITLAALAPRADTALLTDALDGVFKRTFDVVISAVILFLTAPIAMLVALAIWLEDRGSVFYRCERFGAHGQKLQLLKFRKMQPDADGPPLTANDDDRFTRVGRLLARTKLDELPQLLNVVKGEMSLVGPRPEDLEFVDIYPEEFAKISQVRPGITGLCQLAFAKEAEIIGGDDRVRTYTERYLPAKLRIDLLYVEQRSLMLDLKIMLWTALVLLHVNVAVNRETGELTLRRRV